VVVEEAPADPYIKPPPCNDVDWTGLVDEAPPKPTNVDYVEGFVPVDAPALSPCLGCPKLPNP